MGHRPQAPRQFRSRPLRTRLREAGGFPPAQVSAEWSQKRSRLAPDIQRRHQHRRHRDSLFAPRMASRWGWRSTFLFRRARIRLAHILAPPLPPNRTSIARLPRTSATTSARSFRIRLQIKWSALLRTRQTTPSRRQFLTDPYGGFYLSGFPISSAQHGTVITKSALPSPVIYLLSDVGSVAAVASSR